jgi:hypothetical protein
MELIIASLAARPHANEENDSHLVFDKVGTTYTLSELWEPGYDGILVDMTKGKHEHHVIPREALVTEGASKEAGIASDRARSRFLLADVRQCSGP